MAELKTQPTGASVADFLNSVADEKKRQDAYTLLKMMQEEMGVEPKMWGPAIVGFGDMRYKYASGREGDWFPMGFSPRKQALTVYITGGFEPHAALLSQLGKYTTGMGCLYIKRLSDIDLPTLRQIVSNAAAASKARRE